MFTSKVICNHLYISSSSITIFSELQHYTELLLYCKINIRVTLSENFFGIYDFSVIEIFETASCITVQKMKFSFMDFFSKCDQIRSFLQIWSHLLKKCVMKNFIFCAMYCVVTLLAASLFVLNFFNGSNSLTLISTFFYWNVLLYSNSFSKWYPSLCTAIELRYSNTYGNRDVMNTLQNKMNIASWFA